MRIFQYKYIGMDLVMLWFACVIMLQSQQQSTVRRLESGCNVTMFFTGLFTLEEGLPSVAFCWRDATAVVLNLFI